MSGENVCGRTFSDIFQMFGLVRKQDTTFAVKQFHEVIGGGGIQWLIVSNILYWSNYTEMKKKIPEKKREKKRKNEQVMSLWDMSDTGNPCQPRPACHTATLLLQASLSPDGWRVGLLMVKGDIRWTTCVSTCVSAHSS